MSDLHALRRLIIENDVQMGEAAYSPPAPGPKGDAMKLERLGQAIHKAHTVLISGIEQYLEVLNSLQGQIPEDEWNDCQADIDGKMEIIREDLQELAGEREFR